MELGGNIELIGFSERESAELIILKKIIGNYARKFADTLENYEKLVITLKEVHGSKYELHAKLLDGGNPINAETTDNNLFVAVANILKKLESQGNKKRKK